jgi:hypothetical protein
VELRRALDVPPSRYRTLNPSESADECRIDELGDRRLLIAQSLVAFDVRGADGTESEHRQRKSRRRDEQGEDPPPPGATGERRRQFAGHDCPDCQRTQPLERQDFVKIRGGSGLD